MFELVKMFGGLVGRVPMGHLWYFWRKMQCEKLHRFDSQVRINSFFPPWPSPAFSRFFDHVANRRRVPLSVYVSLTPHCPFRCRHCSVTSRRPSEMTHELTLDVLSQIRRLGACIVGFTGGEPLLRKDLPELIASLQGDVTSMVFTTGWGLTPDLARQLKAAGLDCLTIAIESASPKTHDAARNFEGSFQAAELAIGVARDAGLYTAVSTVGTHAKISSGELEKIYDKTRQWGVQEFRLVASVATGEKAGCTTFLLRPEEHEKLANFHRDNNAAKAGGPTVASSAYLESDEFFGCGAGYNHLFIDSAGEVCPCDFMPLSFGNCTQKPLAEIWKEMNAYFPRPRCGCIMNRLAGKIKPDSILPLPVSQSQTLISPPARNAPLPQGYLRFLKKDVARYGRV